ncbi:hypothetical protein P167DRAFT_253777 [Morchella conica CCBAS932]|uniref:Uncharacterized protein n=1 Tax=Morchella conica CCBAS932 TaxID=1392247 RepID=A0A3N4KPW1_9PEZI|nr:hypothetical protein P167DRAFT_253777 [Morchella conica CCBAS932]
MIAVTCGYYCGLRSMYSTAYPFPIWGTRVYPDIIQYLSFGSSFSVMFVNPWCRGKSPPLDLLTKRPPCLVIQDFRALMISHLRSCVPRTPLNKDTHLSLYQQIPGLAFIKRPHHLPWLRKFRSGLFLPWLLRGGKQGATVTSSLTAAPAIE